MDDCSASVEIVNHREVYETARPLSRLALHAQPTSVKCPCSDPILDNTMQHNMRLYWLNASRPSAAYCRTASLVPTRRQRTQPRWPSHCREKTLRSQRGSARPPHTAQQQLPNAPARIQGQHLEKFNDNAEAPHAVRARRRSPAKFRTSSATWTTTKQVITHHHRDATTEDANRSNKAHGPIQDSAEISASY